MKYRMKSVALALVVALILSLVPTAVGADGNNFGGSVGAVKSSNGGWQPWVGASVTAQGHRTEIKAGSFISWNLLYCGDAAQTWNNGMPQSLLNIPTGLPSVTSEVAIAPFVEMPDGRQSFKTVWVTEYPLFDNITPQNPLLRPLPRDPCKGFVDCFTPANCNGGTKYRYYYALVGGAKRNETGLYIPVVSNFAPNLLVRVTHNDGFQMIGSLQFTTSPWVGPAPRSAAELGDRMVRLAGSGGVSYHTYQNLAQNSYDDAMQIPLPPGGYRIAFWSGGVPYTGFIEKITMDGSSSHIVGEHVKGPVLMMGSTTPKTYRYTFVFSDGKIKQQDFTVGSDLVMNVQLP